MASSTTANNAPPAAAAAATSTFVTAKLKKPDWTSPKQPVVVLSCGSFSPVTFLHLRLFEMARDHLNQGNFDVIGGFASPVSDGYNKKGLAPIEHRLNMVEAALTSSSWVSVDRWEGLNPQWTPTVSVMRHFQEQINQFAGSDTKNGRTVRVFLLCGSDLLDSFNTPNLWAHQDMLDILQKFGVIVIERDTAATSNVIFGNDMLFANQEHIQVVKQYVVNDISSTKVRLFVKRGLSLKYLTPDPVIDYIQKHNLYK